MYYSLHLKTHISIKYLLIDNIIVAIIAATLTYVVFGPRWYTYIISVSSLPVYAFLNLQLRFWRNPNRKLTATENQIVSPADGNIIYIKRIEERDEFVSVKKGDSSALHEIIQTDLVKTPCWQIGINMTPFDVHRNCSPIHGKILLSKHTKGKYLSLKNPGSVSENERHTYVIENQCCRIAVVQIASKQVRRIDSYVVEGQEVDKGTWIGMIRFGSQVDIFLPISAVLKVKLKQQLYAKSSIIAELV